MSVFSILSLPKSVVEDILKDVLGVNAGVGLMDAADRVSGRVRGGIGR